MIIPLAVLPQFVAPERGPVFVQSIVPGMVQIAISFSVNLLIALFELSAVGVASWFTHKPAWLATQRHSMGTVLGALALRLTREPRRTA